MALIPPPDDLAAAAKPPQTATDQPQSAPAPAAAIPRTPPPAAASDLRRMVGPPAPATAQAIQPPKRLLPPPEAILRQPAPATAAPRQAIPSQIPVLKTAPKTVTPTIDDLLYPGANGAQNFTKPLVLGNLDPTAPPVAPLAGPTVANADRATSAARADFVTKPLFASGPPDAEMVDVAPPAGIEGATPLSDQQTLAPERTAIQSTVQPFGAGKPEQMPQYEPNAGVLEGIAQAFEMGKATTKMDLRRYFASFDDPETAERIDKDKAIMEARNSELARKPKGFWEGAVQAAAGSAPFIGMSMATAPVALFTTYAQGTGNLQGKLEANGVDPRVAVPMAHIGGFVYGMIERLQASVPGLKGLGGDVADVLAKKVMARVGAAGLGRLTARLAKYGAYVGMETLEDTSQEISDITTEVVAASLHELIGATGTATKPNLREAAKRTWESTKGGFGASLIIGPMTGGLNLNRDDVARQTAADVLGGLEDKSPASKAAAFRKAGFGDFADHLEYVAANATEAEAKVQDTIRSMRERGIPEKVANDLAAANRAVTAANTPEEFNQALDAYEKASASATEWMAKARQTATPPPIPAARTAIPVETDQPAKQEADVAPQAAPGAAPNGKRLNPSYISVRDIAIHASRKWDQANRHSRQDAWFEGGKITGRSGFNDAMAAGGERLQAHGMSKEWTLSGGLKNLLGLLDNGLDMNRRGGVLDTAPLVSKPGEGLVGATASGSAYTDGPFMLVARPGQSLSGNLSGLGAVLVNDAHADIVDQIRAAIQTSRPGMLVETYSNAGKVAAQLLATTQAPNVAPQAAPGAAPATQEAEAVQRAANEASTSPNNDLPEPTEAQKEAGNYKKGHVTVDGLRLTIENPAGSRRRPEWAPLMDHYGYVKGTEGHDGDQVDTFIHPDHPSSDRVYVVDQVDPKTGQFDEHKVILGANSQAEAESMYARNYEPDWKGMGRVRSFNQDEFKTWLDLPPAQRGTASVEGPRQAIPTEPASTPPVPAQGEQPPAGDGTRGGKAAPLEGGPNEAQDQGRQAPQGLLTEQQTTKSGQRAIEGEPTPAPAGAPSRRQAILTDQSSTPPMRSTEDAEAYGRTVAGDEAAIARLKSEASEFDELAASSMAKADEPGITDADRDRSLNSASDFAFRAQLRREAADTARKTATKGSASENQPARQAIPTNVRPEAGQPQEGQPRPEAERPVLPRPEPLTTDVAAGAQPGATVPAATPPVAAPTDAAPPQSTAWTPTAATRAKQGLNPQPTGTRIPKTTVRTPRASPLAINGTKGAGIANSEALRGLYAALARWGNSVADLFAGGGVVDLFIAEEGHLKGKQHIMSEWEPLRAIAWRRIAGPTFQNVASQAEAMMKGLVGMMADAEKIVKEASGTNMGDQIIAKVREYLMAMPDPSGGRATQQSREVAADRVANLFTGYFNAEREAAVGGGGKFTEADARKAASNSVRRQMLRWWAEVMHQTTLAPGQDLEAIGATQREWGKTLSDLSTLAEALSPSEPKSKEAQAHMAAVKAARPMVEARLAKLKAKLDSMVVEPPALNDDDHAAAVSITLQWAMGSQNNAQTQLNDDGTLRNTIGIGVSVNPNRIDTVLDAIRKAHDLLQGADVRRADSWKLIESLPAGTSLVVDPSYFGKNRKREGTSNYGVVTEIKTPEDLLHYIDTYLLPAWSRGSRMVITNTWDNWTANQLQLRGFNVTKFQRSGNEDELVAWNFAPDTGTVFSQPPGAQKSPTRGDQNAAPDATRPAGSAEPASSLGMGRQGAEVVQRPRMREPAAVGGATGSSAAGDAATRQTDAGAAVRRRRQAPRPATPAERRAEVAAYKSALLTRGDERVPLKDRKDVLQMAVDEDAHTLNNPLFRTLFDFALALGVDVVFVKSLGSEGVNLVHRPNTIFVRTGGLDGATADAVMVHALAHELLHALGTANPAAYSAMAARIKSLATGWPEWRARAANLWKTDNDAVLTDELVADALGEIMATKAMRERFLRGMATENPGLLRHILDVLTTLMDHVRTLLDEAHMASYAFDNFNAVIDELAAFVAEAEAAKTVDNGPAPQFSPTRSTLPGWTKSTKPGFLIGWRGEHTPGLPSAEQMARNDGGTEGVGLYIARDRKLASEFRGRVRKVEFPAPVNPLLVDDEPLHILQETDDVMDPPSPTDSPWLAAHKEAIRRTGITDETWPKKQVQLQRALTDVLLERGHDAVHVKAGDEWVVILAKPNEVLPFSPRRTERTARIDADYISDLLDRQYTPRNRRKSDETITLETYEENRDAPWMAERIAAMNATADEVDRLLEDVPYDRGNLLDRIATRDPILEYDNPNGIWPIPVYVSAEGDENTIGLLLHRDGRKEMFEGNDEATGATLDLVTKLLGNGDQMVAVWTSQPSEIVQQIRAGNIPAGIYVSPNRQHAEGYWGEGRELTRFRLPMNRIAQESDVDWKVREAPAASMSPRRKPYVPEPPASTRTTGDTTPLTMSGMRVFNAKYGDTIEEEELRAIMATEPNLAPYAVLRYWQTIGFAEIANNLYPDITAAFENAVQRLPRVKTDTPIFRFQGYKSEKDMKAALASFTPGRTVEIRRPANAFSDMQEYGMDMATTYGGEYLIRFVVHKPHRARSISALGPHKSIPEGEIVYARGDALTVVDVELGRHEGYAMATVALAETDAAAANAPAFSPRRPDERGDDRPATKPRFVTSWKDLTIGNAGAGFFILPDGRLLDISNDFFDGGTNDHVGYIAALDNPEIVGVTKATIAAAKAVNYEALDDDGSISQWYDDLWSEVRETGIFRARLFASERTTGKMTVAVEFIQPGRIGLRQLQDLILNEQVPSGPNVTYMWESIGDDYGSAKGSDAVLQARNFRDLSSPSMSPRRASPDLLRNLGMAVPYTRNEGGEYVLNTNRGAAIDNLTTRGTVRQAFDSTVVGSEWEAVLDYMNYVQNHPTATPKQKRQALEVFRQAKPSDAKPARSLARGPEELPMRLRDQAVEGVTEETTTPEIFEMAKKAFDDMVAGRDEQDMDAGWFEELRTAVYEMRPGSMATTQGLSERQAQNLREIGTTPEKPFTIGKMQAYRGPEGWMARKNKDLPWVALRDGNRTFLTLRTGLEARRQDMLTAEQAEDDGVDVPFSPQRTRFSPDRSPTGEYWYSDGQLMGADGDIGDMNHEAYATQAAMERVADALNLDTDGESIMLEGREDEIDEELELDDPDAKDRDAAIIARLVENGMDQAEAEHTLDTAYGKGDAREYGVERLGWIRVKGTDVDVQRITPDSMREVADAIGEAMDSEGIDDAADEDVLVSVYEYATKRYFQGIPLNILKSGDVGAMRLHADRDDGTGAKFSPRRPVTPEQDAEYMKAVEAGDTATAQRMVDEAAKAAGYTIGPVWHGSDAKGFTRFKRGPAFFTTNIPMAGDYGEEVRRFYLRDGFVESMDVGDFDRNQDAALRRARATGADVLHVAELDGPNADAYVILRNQATAIKSADPITRDDAGNVVPLSQRFNPASPDIRFSPTRSRNWSFSRLLRAIETFPAGATEPKTGQQWKGWIAKMGKAATVGKQWQGGVSKAEIEWTGINDWLKDGQRYTRAQVADYVRAHQVQLTVTVRKDAPSDADERDMAELKKLGYEIQSDDGEEGYLAKDGEAVEFTDAPPEVQELAKRVMADGPTKYADGNYVLPGGTNQREITLSMPTNRPSFDEWLKREYAISSDNLTDERRSTLAQEYADTVDHKGTFISSHYPEPNIVVHYRTNDREVPKYTQDQVDDVEQAIQQAIDADIGAAADKEVEKALKAIRKLPGFADTTRDWEVRVESVNESFGQRSLRIVNSSGTTMAMASGTRLSDEEFIAAVYAEDNGHPKLEKALREAARERTNAWRSSMVRVTAEEVDAAEKNRVITPEDAAIYRHAKKLLGNKKGAAHRTLLIDEIQSDLHQKGRKHGYRKPIPESEIAKFTVDPSKEKWVIRIPARQLTYEEAETEVASGNPVIVNSDREGSDYVTDLSGIQHHHNQYGNANKGVVFYEVTTFQEESGLSEYSNQDAAHEAAHNRTIKQPYYRRLIHHVIQTEGHGENDFTVRDGSGRVIATPPKKFNKTPEEALRVIQKQARDGTLAGLGAVPDLPFKDSSEHGLLAFKHLLRYAAEQDYDAIAWTPGQVQIDRYNEAMRQNVDRITVEPVVESRPSWATVSTSTTTMVKVEAYKDGQGKFSERVPLTGTATVAGKQDIGLEDVIGKELADKVRAAPDRKHDFEGDNLAIGGQGMKEFYDKKLPGLIEKYVAKWGGKIGTTELKKASYSSATQAVLPKFKAFDKHDEQSYGGADNFTDGKPPMIAQVKVRVGGEEMDSEVIIDGAGIQIWVNGVDFSAMWADVIGETGDPTKDMAIESVLTQWDEPRSSLWKAVNFETGDGGKVTFAEGNRVIPAQQVTITPRMRFAALHEQPLLSPRRGPSDDELEAMAGKLHRQVEPGLMPHAIGGKRIPVDPRWTEATRDVLGAHGYERQAMEEITKLVNLEMQDGESYDAKLQRMTEDNSILPAVRVGVTKNIFDFWARNMGVQKGEDYRLSHAQSEKARNLLDMLAATYGRAVNYMKTFSQTLWSKAGAEAWYESMRDQMIRAKLKPVQPVVQQLEIQAEDMRKAKSGAIATIDEVGVIKSTLAEFQEKYYTLLNDRSLEAAKIFRKIVETKEWTTGLQATTVGTIKSERSTAAKTLAEKLAAIGAPVPTLSPARGDENGPAMPMKLDKDIENYIVLYLAEDYAANNMQSGSEMKRLAEILGQQNADRIVESGLLNELTRLAKIKVTKTAAASFPTKRVGKKRTTTIQNMEWDTTDLYADENIARAQAMAGKAAGPSGPAPESIVTVDDDAIITTNAAGAAIAGPVEVSAITKTATPRQQFGELIMWAINNPEKAGKGEPIQYPAQTPKDGQKVAITPTVTVDEAIESGAIPVEVAAIIPASLKQIPLGALEAWSQGRPEVEPSDIYAGYILRPNQAQAVESSFLTKRANQYMRDIGMTFRQLVEQHYSQQKQTKVRLANLLKEELGLQPYAALIVAGAVERHMEKAMEAQRQKSREAFKKMLENIRPGRKLRRDIDELMRLINLGVLERHDITNEWGKLLGIPEITPEIRAGLQKRAEAIRTAPDAVKQYAVAEMVDYIEQQMPKDAWRLVTTYMYANLLSGYADDVRNVAGNLSNDLINLMATAASNPKAAPMLFAGAFRRASAAPGEILAALRGQAVVRTAGKLEYKGELKFDGRIANLISGAVHIPFRMLTAADMLAFKPQAQRYAEWYAFQAMLRDGVPYATAWRQAIDSIHGTATERAEWKRQAEALFPDSKLRQARAAEDIRLRVAADRAPEAVAYGQQMAAAYTLNTIPEDAGFGKYHHAMSGLLNPRTGTGPQKAGMRLFGSWVGMFSRIATNMAIMNTSYLPGFGMASAITEKDAVRKRVLWARQGIGFIAAAALVLLDRDARTPDDDDDEEERERKKMNPSFAIYGAGPVDAPTRNAMRRLGWSPYTVKIGDRYWKYQVASGPLAFVFTAVGVGMDYDRGWRLGKSAKADAAGQGAHIAIGIVKAFTEMSFLSGLSQFFTAIGNADMGDKPAKAMLISQMNKLFPSAAIRTAKEFGDANIYETETFGAALTATFPYAAHAADLRPRLDLFGQPLTRQGHGEGFWKHMAGIFTAAQKEDPLIQWLVANNAVWSPRQQPDDMHPDDYYAASAESGKAIRARLERYYANPQNRKKPADAIEDDVDEIVRDEWKAARARYPRTPAEK